MEEKGGEIVIGNADCFSIPSWATAAKPVGLISRDHACLRKQQRLTNGQAVACKCADPGVNEPPPCGIVIELVGTTYERIFPSEPGTFECNESWNAGFTNRWTDDAELDENRVSQKFTAE